MESLNPTVAALFADHVDVTPRRVDWREEAKRGTSVEDPGYHWSEVVECPKCKRQIATVDGALVDHNVAPDVDADDEHPPCDGSGDYVDAAEGPMMDYFYPCTFADLESAAESIADLPLCAVTLYDGEQGLALTGGGMDLSWEICEAYIRLGHLPPVHFDLPNMASRGLTERALLVLDAMEASLGVVAARAERARERLASIRADYSSRVIGPANEAGVPADEMLLAERISDACAPIAAGGAGLDPASALLDAFAAKAIDDAAEYAADDHECALRRAIGKHRAGCRSCARKGGK